MTDTLTLRGGAVTSDPRLDRIPLFDERSRAFPIRAVVAEKPPRSYTWGFTQLSRVWLDQRAEGACVGFGWAHELALRPQALSAVTDEMARQFYFAFQKRDPWEGGAYPGANPHYEGTAVIAGAQEMRDRGFIGEYRWAFGLRDTVLSVGYAGPNVMGTDWDTSMFDTDADGFLRPNGNAAGGHCWVARGTKVFWIDRAAPKTWANVDLVKSYVVGRNSWGPDWGINGDFKITFADLGSLLDRGGESCVPLKRALP